MEEKGKDLLLVLAAHELDVLEKEFFLLPAQGAEALQHGPLPGGDRVGRGGVVGEAKEIIGGNMKIPGKIDQHIIGHSSLTVQITAQSVFVGVEVRGQCSYFDVTVCLDSFCAFY